MAWRRLPGTRGEFIHIPSDSSTHRCLERRNVVGSRSAGGKVVRVWVSWRREGVWTWYCRWRRGCGLAATGSRYLTGEGNREDRRLRSEGEEMAIMTKGFQQRGG